MGCKAWHFVESVGEPLRHHQVVILGMVKAKTSVLDSHTCQMSLVLLELEPDPTEAIIFVDSDCLGQLRSEVFDGGRW